MDDNLEEYKILAEEFQKYIEKVKRKTLETFQESEGTKFELGARTAANCVNGIYNRWHAAYSSVANGQEFTFPDTVGINKEEDAEE